MKGNIGARLAARGLLLISDASGYACFGRAVSCL